MKFLVVAFVVAKLSIANCKTLPDYLPDPCPKSDPDYTACILKSVNKIGPYLLKGIPEYNIPKMDPYELPVMVVNRTLNDFVSINAILKNIKIVGLAKTYINDLKTDIQKNAGEIKFTVPSAYLSMEYNVVGQLFAIPLRSRGHFRGNFNDTVVHIKGSLKQVERDGVKYFAMDKFKVKSRVGDGYIKLTAKNPRDQFAADLITTFFNENPRRTLDAVNPLYIAAAKDFYVALLEQGLARIPAEELLPQ